MGRKEDDFDIIDMGLILSIIFLLVFLISSFFTGAQIFESYDTLKEKVEELKQVTSFTPETKVADTKDIAS